jgi:hypothetical protein
MEVVLMVMIVLFSLLGSWVSLGGGFSTAPSVTLVESDNSHVVVQVDLSGYDLQQLSGYSRFTLEGYDWDFDSPIGSPELPVIPVVVGLPAGMEPSVSVIDAQWIPSGQGRPYPVQPLRTDDEVEPFAFAELSDNLQGTYPSTALSLVQHGNWAGLNTVVLQVKPVSWDASTRQFQIASSISARVEFSGERQPEVSVRPEVARIHSSRAINYQSLGIPVDSSPISMTDNVYICVVPPENLDSVTPLLAMVNSLGHHVKIIEMNTGSTSYTIRSAIQAEYQEGTTRFVLIPARHQQLESKQYNGFVGDFYYELMGSDNYPDVAVGRFSGNSTKIPNQISKTMSYITYQGQSGVPSVPASAVLSAHQENYPNKYTANCEAVRTWNYRLANIQFKTVYPPAGGTPDSVVNAINGGVGIVNYRGHGSITTWQWTGGWNAGSIYGLTNTFFPPVFNVCCNNGQHELSYNCLAESWMDAPGVGASGNLAASAPSGTYANNRMQKVLFWQIFDEGNTCAGEVVSASQVDAVQRGALKNARMYHWFGDPSMDISNSDSSGAPFALDFTVPSALNIGPNTLHIVVTSGGTAVEGVVVTVTDGIGNHSSHTESFYEQQTTNSSGEVWLSFTALEGKDLYYGARLHNYASVTGTISVVTQGIETEEVFAAELNSITPSPVSGTAAVSFTLPVSGQVAITVMDVAGRVVQTVENSVLPAGEGSTVLDVSRMAPGVYFVSMQTADTVVTRKIAVVH